MLPTENVTMDGPRMEGLLPFLLTRIVSLFPPALPLNPPVLSCVICLGFQLSHAGITYMLRFIRHRVEQGLSPWQVLLADERVMRA